MGFGELRQDCAGDEIEVESDQEMVARQRSLKRRVIFRSSTLLDDQDQAREMGCDWGYAASRVSQALSNRQ